MRATDRRDEAKEMLETACSLDRENANYQKWLGLVFMETGDLVTALEFTKTSLELSQKDVTAYVQLGAILNALGDLELAEKALRSGLDIAGEDTRCRAELSGVLIELGRLEEAKKELDHTIKRDGDEHPSVLSNLALLESVNGNGKLAYELVEKAMEMDAKSIDVLLTAHKVFTNLDDKEKIDGVLESIQNVAPDDARVLNLLFV
jgi:tetratricopeptide (TPR) repeat protein